MAIQPIKFLVSPSATASNGSKTITVTGNVDCSHVYSGTAIALGTRQVVEAVSGTKPDVSGNSVITLRDNWADPTTTAKLVAFNTIEGLAEAIRRAREVVQASEAALSGNVSYMGDHSAATGNFPAAPGEGLGSQIYRISVAGAISGRDYKVGELIYYDQYFSQWRSFFDGFGTAAQRNVGSGTGELLDNQELNRRLGTSGNLGNAAQRNIGTGLADLSDNNQLNTRLGTTANLGALALLNSLAILLNGSNNSTSSVLANPNGIAGPYINARWSVDTVNRFLEIVAQDNLANVQSGFEVNSDGLFRIAVNRSAKFRLYDTANILGTVSRSGSTTTGAILERGVSGMWQYTKYADGRLEYTLPPKFWDAIGGGAPSVPFFTNDNLFFPVPFFGVEPSISVQYIGRAAYEENTAQAHNLSLSGVQVSCRLVTSVSGPRYTLTAIGRWY